MEDVKKFVTDFPEEYRETLFRLEAKHEVLRKLKWFQKYGMGGWSMEIARIEGSIPILLSSLPTEILMQYIAFQERRDKLGIFQEFT